MQNAPEAPALLGLGAVFTVLFVTLGPLKVLGPFAQLTRDAEEGAMRQIAVRSFAIAMVAAVAGGFVGRALLLSWNVPLAALLLAGGIIFFLVGLRLVLEQYQPSHPAPPPLPPAPMAAAMEVTFPMVVTPYGIAALIVLFANSRDAVRTASILAILAGVMALNLLAMLYARRVMRGGTLIALRILGAVLGVLQVALAVQIILRALRDLGVLHG